MNKKEKDILIKGIMLLREFLLITLYQRNKLLKSVAEIYCLNVKS